MFGILLLSKYKVHENKSCNTLYNFNFDILEKKTFTWALYLRYANYVQTYIFGEKKEQNEEKRKGRDINMVIVHFCRGIYVGNLLVWNALERDILVFKI